MHYYKRNIGDYAKKAGKLSMLQHGAYTLLIDACYDRERFPTIDDAIDWAWAESDDEKQAVMVVLRRFFTLRDGFYVQDRITEELKAYKSISEENSRIAREREAKKKAQKSTEREPFVHEPAPNHKPLTTNHKPLTKNTDAIATPDGVSNSVWQDFKKSRKVKLTQTALDGIKREADKAGWTLENALKECCSRGWRGFKADWVQEKRTGYLTPQPNETTPSKPGIDPTLAKLNEEAKYTKPPSAEMRAKLDALKQGRLQ